MTQFEKTSFVPKFYVILTRVLAGGILAKKVYHCRCVGLCITSVVDRLYEFHFISATPVNFTYTLDRADVTPISFNGPSSYDGTRVLNEVPPSVITGKCRLENLFRFELRIVCLPDSKKFVWGACFSDMQSNNVSGRG